MGVRSKILLFALAFVLGVAFFIIMFAGCVGIR